MKYIEFLDGSILRRFPRFCRTLTLVPRDIALKRVWLRTSASSATSTDASAWDGQNALQSFPKFLYCHWLCTPYSLINIRFVGHSMLLFNFFVVFLPYLHNAQLRWCKIRCSHCPLTSDSDVNMCNLIDALRRPAYLPLCYRMHANWLRRVSTCLIP